MTEIFGLTGLRPGVGYAKAVTCPPYDVIKNGTKLEASLAENSLSLYHVVLGDDPVQSLKALLDQGALIIDEQPSYYIYEQNFNSQCRLGLLTAVAVTPYSEQEIIRHEKTFEEKVQGRIALMEETGYVTEPVWLISKAEIKKLMIKVTEQRQPIYDFTSDFDHSSELHGIRNRIFKVYEDEPIGRQIKALISEQALYIADGHHRYHSALRMGLKQCISYICEANDAQILAYNRVIKGKVAFDSIKNSLPLQEESDFKTPSKHQFSIFTKEGIYSYKVNQIPKDPVQKLDCHILEKTLYPLLKLDHSMINNLSFFDYYSETELNEMCNLVKDNKYDLAVALHPVDIEELLAVADAGINDPQIVMPEKSTFFAPKILSGLFLMPNKK